MDNSKRPNKNTMEIKMSAEKTLKKLLFAAEMSDIELMEAISMEMILGDQPKFDIFLFKDGELVEKLPVVAKNYQEHVEHLREINSGVETKVITLMTGQEKIAIYATEKTISKSRRICQPNLSYLRNEYDFLRIIYAAGNNTKFIEKFTNLFIRDIDLRMFIACRYGLLNMVRQCVLSNRELVNVIFDNYCTNPNGYREMDITELGVVGEEEYLYEDGRKIPISRDYREKDVSIDSVREEKVFSNIFFNTRITPLHVACWNGQLEVVKFLLQEGANIDEFCDCDEGRLYPYQCAIINGHNNVFKYIVHEGSFNEVNSISGLPDEESQKLYRDFLVKFGTKADVEMHDDIYQVE